MKIEICQSVLHAMNHNLCSKKKKKTKTHDAKNHFDRLQPRSAVAWLRWPPQLSRRLTYGLCGVGCVGYTLSFVGMTVDSDCPAPS